MGKIAKLIFGFMLVICSVGTVMAELPTEQLTTPQNISFADCTKTYNISGEKLFYLTLESITANRFEIKEMQTKTGYILFRAAGKEFLATVAYYGLNKSLLKITPTNNSYYFAPGIVSNIFKYIDLNLDDSPLTVPKS